MRLISVVDSYYIGSTDFGFLMFRQTRKYQTSCLSWMITIGGTGLSTFEIMEMLMNENSYPFLSIFISHRKKNCVCEYYDSLVQGA